MTWCRAAEKEAHRRMQKEATQSNVMLADQARAFHAGGLLPAEPGQGRNVARRRASDSAGGS